MSISVQSGGEYRISPSQSDSDCVRRILKSRSGKFIASVTESVVSVHCQFYGGLSLVGTLDVGDIFDSAGEEFAQTEGSFSDVVFDPSDSLVFLSTTDSLVGVAKIESSKPKEPDEMEETGGFVEVVSGATGEQKFTLRLITVLLFPIKHVLLAPSLDNLYAIGTDKRVLFVIDWKKYQARARRFLIPPLGDCGDSGSPCINSVLPQSSETDLAQLEPEDIHISQAIVSEDADSLIVLYKNGLVRCLALSRPSDKMCVVLQCPSATSIAASKGRLAVACESWVYVYQLTSHATSSLLFKTQSTSQVFALDWSEEYLTVGTRDEICIYNKQGTGILVTHPLSETCQGLIVSLPLRYIAVIERNSSEVILLSLLTSADMFTRCSSPLQSQLLIGADSFNLYSFPCHRLRRISGPASYIQENGQINSASLRINASSSYIRAVAERGFALWSSSSSGFTSLARKEGRWEVLQEVSQEEKLGRIDVFGFLSETVFFTHTQGAKELILWSVLKRIDVGFTLGSTKLVSSGDIQYASCNSEKGLVVLTYEKENRLDVYKLQGDPKNGTYSLGLVAKLPCDFPQSLRSLVLVSSHTVLGVSESDEVFLRTGERVCGSTQRVFTCGPLGLGAWKPSAGLGYGTSLASTGEASTPRHVATPDRTTNSSRSSSNTDNVDQDEEDYDGDETDFQDAYSEEVVSLGPTSSPLVYFIGEKNCKFCLSLSRVPKLKRKVVALIQRGNPLVFMLDVAGNIGVWAVCSSARFAGRLEYVVRFEDASTDVSCQPIGVSGEFGVLASVSNTGHVSLTSAVHPVLSLIPAEEAHKVCVQLEHSPFFGAIMEMWLHSSLSASLPLLSKLDPQNLAEGCLSQSSEAICQHSLVRTTLDRLETAFNIASHFPSVFASVFAAAVRKSEPHITFPLATCGGFGGMTAEELFLETVKQRRLREAALLLVIIQESTGPVNVRERFGIPLFRESLIDQEYELGRDIAHFHFSYSKRLRSPINRQFTWRPESGSSTSEDDLVEHLLRSAIETVVVSHLNFLTNESMDWHRLIRFSESLRLVLSEWLLLVPRQEYLDLAQLVSSFRLMLSVCPESSWSPLVDLLAEAFQQSRWIAHWKALAVAAGSGSMLRDCLEQSKEDNSTVVTEADVESILTKYMDLN